MGQGIFQTWLLYVSRLQRLIALLFSCFCVPIVSAELTLYIHSNTPPFEWREGDHERGFNPELAQYIADEMDISLLLEQRNLTEVVDAIASQETSGIAFVADSTASHPLLTYSKPLNTTYAAAYNRKGQAQIDDFGDLKGKRVGIKKSSFVARYMQKNTSGIDLVYFKSNAEAFLLLADGGLDYVISEFYCSWHLLSLFDNIKTGSGPLIRGNFYIISSSLNKSLSAHINSVVERLSQDGTLDQLTKRRVDFGRERIDSVTIKNNSLHAAIGFGVFSSIGLIVTLVGSFHLRRRKLYLQQELNERKAAEFRIREISVLFQSVLDDMPHGIIIWDEYGSPLWSNTKFESKLTGRQLTSSNGWPFNFDNLFQDFCQQHQPNFIELRDEDSFWNIQIHRIDHGRVLVMLEDTTERTQLRIENDIAARQVALGEISAGIAHEINNPLGLINESVRFIRYFLADVSSVLPEIEAQDPHWRIAGMLPAEALAEIDYQVESMEHSVGNMSRIVKGLKTLSQPGSVRHYAPVSLVQVIDSALWMTSSQTKRHQLHWESGSEALYVFGDEVQLQLVVINFIQNACQAIPNEAQGKIEVGIGCGGDKVWLQVRDNGIGISAHQLERICEPFFTTRRNEGGTGLGLALCNRIILEHRGQWNIQSEQGQGTSMTVSFEQIHAPTAPS
ncbi:MAG: ATP-binding protein [Shewanella sp.]